MTRFLSHFVTASASITSENRVCLFFRKLLMLELPIYRLIPQVSQSLLLTRAENRRWCLRFSQLGNCPFFSKRILQILTRCPATNEPRSFTAAVDATVKPRWFTTACPTCGCLFGLKLRMNCSWVNEAETNYSLKVTSWETVQRFVLSTVFFFLSTSCRYKSERSGTTVEQEDGGSLVMQRCELEACTYKISSYAA